MNGGHNKHPNDHAFGILKCTYVTVFRAIFLAGSAGVVEILRVKVDTRWPFFEGRN
jgi:hypothetical protein